MDLIDTQKFLKYAICFVGTFCIFLGGLAIVGWYFKIDVLIKIAPGVVPMVYDTALSFLLLGAALLFLTAKNPKYYIANGLSIFVFLISLFVLFQHVLSADFKIDSLFAYPYNITKHVNPGRMAPNTTLGFIFASIGVLFLTQKNNKKAKFTMAFFCSFIVLGYSLLCLFSYFSSTPSLPFWEKFTSMAPNTAIGLLVLSFGLLMLIFRLSDEQDVFILNWIPYIVSSYALMTVTLFWVAFKVEELYRIKELLSFIAKHVPYELNYEYHAFVSNAIFVLGILLSILLFFTMRYAQLGRKRLNEIEKIRESFERAQQLVHLGIWVWDLEKNTFWCSDEILKILGLPLGENILKPDNYIELLTADEKDNFRLSISKLVNKKLSSIEIKNVMHVNNTEKIVQLEAKITKIVKNMPVEITGIMQDITERILLERQLKQAQKMEVLGQLTGGLAHDYNNILMLISGNLELLNNELDTNDSKRKRIETALSAVEKGSNLTKRLLGFSRQQSLKPKKVYLSDFLNSFIKMLSPVLGEAIEISVIIENNIWNVWVDPTQLQTALLNLAVNARDAMNSQGKLFFKIQNYTSSETLQSGKTKIEPGDYIKISVTDTGEGMAPQTLEHVFEPFFTTKSIGKGSGLGLSMVYGFVKQSRGYVTVYSELNHGTTISLYLPKMSNENERQEVQDEENEKSKQYSTCSEKYLTVLVVEDDDALRKVTTEFLNLLGHTVFSATNGTEALEILKNQENIDLLLSDVIMPGGMTGIELALSTLKLNSNIKILLMTGYARESLSLKNLPENFQLEIIMKPYSFSDLREKIKTIFDK